MFRKIALGTVLAIGSISGALAWDNIGEVETPSTYVQAPVPGSDAYAAARRHAKTVTQPALQRPTTVDPARDVSNY